MKQIRIHTPSEHTVSGYHTDLEIHFLDEHYGTEMEKEEYVALAVLCSRTPRLYKAGSDQFFDDLIDALDTNRGSQNIRIQELFDSLDMKRYFYIFYVVLYTFL